MFFKNSFNKYALLYIKIITIIQYNFGLISFNKISLFLTDTRPWNHNFAAKSRLGPKFVLNKVSNILNYFDLRTQIKSSHAAKVT